MFLIVLLSIVSFFAGIIDNISGGGGLLQITTLLLTGISPKMVLGTDKLIATTSTIPALYNYIRHNKIVWKLIVFGISFSLLGSFIGTKIILSISSNIVGRIIVFLLPIALVITLIPKRNIKKKSEDFSKLDLFLKLPLICLSIGFYAGFFGAGTGSLFIIALYSLLRLNLVHSAATTRMFTFIANLGALAIFILNKQVNYPFAVPMLITGMIGGYIGSKLVVHKGARIVRFLLVLTLIGLGISLVFKYF